MIDGEFKWCGIEETKFSQYTRDGLFPVSVEEWGAEPCAERGRGRELILQGDRELLPTRPISPDQINRSARLKADRYGSRLA